MKKQTGRAVSIPKGLVLGAGICTCITVLLSWIAAYLISRETIPQKWTGYCVIIILICASCLGSRVAIKKIKRKPLQSAVMCGGIYYLMLIAVTALIFGGQYQGMGVTFLVIAAGCLLGWLTASSKHKMSSKKRYKK